MNDFTAIDAWLMCWLWASAKGHTRQALFALGMAAALTMVKAASRLIA